MTLRIDETGFGARLPTYSLGDADLPGAIDRLLADRDLHGRLSSVASRLQASPGTQRAALLILLLGAALVVALAPYATGIIGIAVLYAILSPVHDWLTRRVRGKLAAGLVVALALFLIVVPGVSFAGLIVNEAQGIAGSVVRSPLLKRLEELQPGGVDLGPRLADLGAKLVSWIGSSAFGLIGTATRLALNLTISLFGLF